MNSEPAGTIGSSISGILVALFLILRASGIVVPDDLESGITALIVGVLAVPAVSGWATRFFVYAPDTVSKLEAAAYVDGVEGDRPPTTR